MSLFIFFSAKIQKFNRKTTFHKFFSVNFILNILLQNSASDNFINFC